MTITFRSITQKAIIFLFLAAFSQIASAQNKDSVKVHEALKATANFQINNNGISLFPNLTYGKPATILNLSVGKKGVFFEPELRWGLSGKPWSYIYWLRYKYKKSEKFGVNVGTHPSYAFKPTVISINGKQENRYVAQRYWASEIVPTYYFSKKFALGLHYLYSKGLDSYAIQHSHFFAIQPKFSYIKASKDYYFSFYPQVFYLALDNKNGIYVSELLSFNKTNLPINISSIFTYKIKSTIPGDNIVWNVGLNYKL